MPDDITMLLGCPPTVAEVKGARGRFPRKGRWALTIDSEDCEDIDLEDGLKIFLAKLPPDMKMWEALAARYKVDIYCGLFLATHNRGFGLSAEIAKMLSDRRLEIGFDIYFDPPATSTLP